ncbi:carbohydrate-binding module family 1 protein [Xylariaceae sp. FL0594]|nr:carbohydrate-binding module family 1 protein [Xylariaceae sp. FL0594]
MSNFRSSLLMSLAVAAGVTAHGHVSNIVINGVSYQNYDPTSFTYIPNPPTVVGWAATNSDNGFVSPDAFSGGDIVCHRSGTPAGGHARVKAGDSISIQWNTWPDSHKGPMIDYLAACNGPCESVDKKALKFFKIDEAGILEPSSAAGSTGTWASDVMIRNNNTWLVQIPASLKAGNYVLRHETIALHSAGQANGAQAYPQCFNLEVTGGGSLAPAGVVASQLYTPTDPGIEVDIYVPGLKYEIPGPALIPGVPSTVRQFSSVITASASATVGGGGSGSGSGATTTTTKVASTTTTTTSKPTTTLVTSTKASTTTKAPTTTTSPSATKTQTGDVAVQTLYGQCGGINWTGPTACAKGSCTQYNPYYSQCVEAAAVVAPVQGGGGCASPKN